MNTPAATRALIARAVAALEAQGRPVAGVMATADKAAIALTVEGLLALVGAGLTTTPPAESSAPVDLDEELDNWATDHAPH